MGLLGTRNSHPGYPAASRLVFPLLAAAGALLFALDQTSGGMPYFRDRLYYFYPQYEACRGAIADGSVPLWNPYVNCGQPLLATWQAAVGSPLSLPFLVFPYADAIRIFWFLVLGLAAAGTYALGGRMGLTPFGAAVAAIVYAGAGPLRTLSEWPNIVQSLAYLPVLLVAMVDLKRGRRGATVAAGLMGALLLLSGQPRQVLVVALAAGALLAALHLADDPRNRKRDGPFLLKLAGAAGIAALVAGMQLLPSIELLLQSDRWHRGVPSGTISESFLHPFDLITVLAARFWGDEDLFFGPGRHLMPRLYLGATGVWLAGCGLAAGRSVVRSFAWTAVPLALVLAMSSPFYPAFAELAAKEQFLRYLGHMIVAGLPAVALLCGRGAEAVLTRPAGRGWTGLWPLAVAGLAALLFSPLGAALPAWLGVPATAFETPYLAKLRTGVAVSAAGLAAAWWARTRVRRPAAGRARGIPALPGAAIVAGVLIADFAVSLHGYEAKAPPEEFTRPKILDRHPLQEGRLFSPWWTTPVYTGMAVSRLDHAKGRYWILAPNIPQLWRIRNANGYEPFLVRLFTRIFSGWDDDLPRMRETLRDFSVRWITAPVNRALPGWIKRDDILPGWALWEDPGGRPLVSVLPSRAESVSLEELRLLPAAGAGRLVRETWNEIEIRAAAASPALVTFTTPRYAGWRAFAGGRRRPVTRAGRTFMAARVPAGSFQVKFVYAPLSFAVGLLLSAVALGGAVTYGCVKCDSASRNRRDARTPGAVGKAAAPRPR